MSDFRVACQKPVIIGGARASDCFCDQRCCAIVDGFDVIRFLPLRVVFHATADHVARVMESRSCLCG